MTQNHKSVALNSLLNFVTKATTAIFTFVSSVFVARKLGPSVMGHYTYLVWIITTFATVGSLGIPMAMKKFTAQYSNGKENDVAKKIGGNWLLISLALGLAMALLLCAFAALNILTANNNPEYFYLISLALPLNILTILVSSVLSGNRLYSTLVKIGVISSPLSFIILVIALIGSHSLANVLVAYLAGSILTFCTTLIFASKQHLVAFGRLPRSVMRPIVKYVITVSGIILLDQIVWDRSEVIFLGHYSSPQQVAFYSMSFTFLSNIMVLVPGSISGAIMPHIAALHGESNRRAIDNAYRQAMRYVGLIVGLLAGGSIALAMPFISSFYGSNYSGMVPVFRILAFTTGWAAVGAVAAAMLYATTKQSVMLKIGLVLSVTNIVADFIVIPHYGAVGAAVANGFSQFWGVVACIYVLKKRGFTFPTLEYLKIGLNTFFSCIPTLLLVTWQGQNNPTTFITAGSFFVLLYVVLGLLTKLIRLNEIPVLNKFTLRGYES